VYMQKSRLNSRERERIGIRIGCHVPYREIGRNIGRSHTTISREIKINSTVCGYNPAVADRAAKLRQRNKGGCKIDHCFELERYIIEKMKLDPTDNWTPEQIAGRWNKFNSALYGVTISYETIYRWIYEGEGRFRGLYLCLPKAHQKRFKRCGRKPRKTPIKERVSIDERPEIINTRQRTGDWESDSMKFKKQKVGLSVQTERKILLVRIHKVENGSREETHRSVVQSIESLPRELWKSTTFDNGSENSCHNAIRDTYNLPTYFCDAYAPWQKGTTENTNGLIRRFLPRETDMSQINDQQIYEIQEKLNNRPRKKLGYLTPNEMLAKVKQDLITGALEM
jgi:IS30 family transposase